MPSRTSYPSTSNVSGSSRSKSVSSRTTVGGTYTVTGSSSPSSTKTVSSSARSPEAYTTASPYRAISPKRNEGLQLAPRDFLDYPRTGATVLEPRAPSVVSSTQRPTSRRYGEVADDPRKTPSKRAQSKPPIKSSGSPVSTPMTVTVIPTERKISTHSGAVELANPRGAVVKKPPPESLPSSHSKGDPRRVAARNMAAEYQLVSQLVPLELVNKVSPPPTATTPTAATTKQKPPVASSKSLPKASPPSDYVSKRSTRSLPTSEKRTGPRFAYGSPPAPVPSLNNIKDKAQKKRLEAILDSNASITPNKDETLSSLFDELRHAADTGLASAAAAGRPDLGSVTTILGLLDRQLVVLEKNAINDKDDRKGTDPYCTPYAFHNSAGAIKKTAELLHVSDPVNKGSLADAPTLTYLCSVCKRKTNLLDKLGQGGPVVAEACKVDLNSGMDALACACMDNPASPVFNDPEFCANGLQLLTMGLGCPLTRIPVMKLVEENPGVMGAAQAAMDPQSGLPSDSPLKKNALEFTMHMQAGNNKPEGVPEKVNPADAMQLEVLMSVARREVKKMDMNDMETKNLKRNNTMGEMLVLNDTEEVLPEIDNTQFIMPTQLAAIIECIRDSKIPKDKRAPLAKQFVDLVCEYATRNRAQEILDLGGHEALLAMMKRNNQDAEVVGYCLQAFTELADQDEQMKTFCAARVVPEVLPETVCKDIDCCDNYIGLLEDLTALDDLTLTVLPLQKVLRDLAVVENCEYSEELVLPERCDDIRKALQHERPELTLKDVYGILMGRQHRGEPNGFIESRLVRRLFAFIRMKMNEYGVEHTIYEGVTSFKGSEFMYGCLCLQLLAGVEDNIDNLVSKNVSELLLDSMRKQTDEEIAQHAILTCVEFCARNRKLAAALANAPGGPATIVWMLARGREATREDLYDEIEDLVLPRVKLIEKTAINRKIYLQSEAMTELLRTWDDHDYYWYGDIQVKNVEDLKKLYRKDKKENRKEAWGLGGVPPPAAGKLPQNEKVAVSPLERRKSVVGVPAIDTSPGGLGRRQSMIPQGGGLGGLTRRASAAFKGEEATASAVPPNRRQSMIQQQQGGGLMKRVSMLGGKQPANDQLPQQERTHASQLQKRASMITPDAFSSPEKSVKLKAAINMDAGKTDAIPSSRMSMRKVDINDPETYREGSEVSADFSVFSSDKKKSRFKKSFSNSSFASTMSRVWKADPADREIFVSQMLEGVFKAMRMTVCDAFVPEMVKFNCPMRLVGIVTDRETAPGCLPDVLFLIGILSGTKALKDQLGELHAVERILNLIQRAYKHQGPFVSEVVANGCLAVANLCVIHRPNTKRFENVKGTELIVSVLRTRGEYNDAQGVNGASALICNLCFKNLDMKEAFGVAGCPQALVAAMAGYQSQHSSQGSRSIASLFKAVGNLALNEENMKLFLESKIDKAYESFLSQADDELDTGTMEACLRTLANLVIEKDCMETFQKVVMPLVAFLRKERDNTPEVHRWAFMTIANLCRAPENAKVFTRNQGIQTVMTILPFIQSSPQLKAAVIYVLGIQTTDPTNIPILIQTGVFGVIRDTLLDYCQAVEHYKKLAESGETGTESSPSKQKENKPVGDGSGLTMAKPEYVGRQNLMAGEAESIMVLTQLPISALRCCHRVLKDKTAAEACAKAEILCLIPATILPSQPMIGYEAAKVFFRTMSFFWQDQAPVPKPVDTRILSPDDVIITMFGGLKFDVIQRRFAESEMHGCESDPCLCPWKIPLPPQVMKQRNPSPRLYSTLGCAEYMPTMVEKVRRTLTSPKAIKNLRLQRVGVGFLAYCAAEKVCVASLFQRLDAEIDPDTGLYVIPDDEEKKAQQMLKAVERGPVKSTLTKRKSILGFAKKDQPEELSEKEKVLQRMDSFGGERIVDPTSIVDIIRNCLAHLWVDLDLMEEVCLLLNNLIFCAVGHPEFSQAIGEVELYMAFTAMMKDKRKQFLEKAAASGQEQEAQKEGHGVFRRKKNNTPANQTRRGSGTPEEDDVRGLKLVVNTIKNYKRFLETQGRLPSVMCIMEAENDLLDNTPLASSMELGLKSSPTMKKGKPTAQSQPALKSRKSILPAAFFKEDDEDIMKAIDDTPDSKTLTVEDLELILKLTVNEFDLELSQHHVDPFPDGVQSLPSTFRNAIRVGGQAELIEGPNKKSIFLWKSSHDLVMLEWKILPFGTKLSDDADPAFPHAIAISRISRLSGGIDSEHFAAAAENMSPAKCMIVGGPPLPSYPAGMLLSLRLKDQKERDTFLQTLATWREASAFGFM